MRTMRDQARLERLRLRAGMQNLLSAFGRAEAMTLVLVLTDGEQTVWGGDNAAMAAAEDLKATGTSVVTLSLGMKRTQPNRHLPPPASA